jgi:hypothetical protein
MVAAEKVWNEASSGIARNVALSIYAVIVHWE